MIKHYWTTALRNLSWWMIVEPGVIVLITTLLTIAGQSIRAALANPAKVYAINKPQSL